LPKLKRAVSGLCGEPRSQTRRRRRFGSQRWRDANCRLEGGAATVLTVGLEAVVHGAAAKNGHRDDQR